MSQWFLDIPKYAQELVDGLDDINFPKCSCYAKDWIGRSEGVEITFTVEDSDEEITVFTTRPDTIRRYLLDLAPSIRSQNQWLKVQNLNRAGRNYMMKFR